VTITIGRGFTAKLEFDSDLRWKDSRNLVRTIFGLGSRYISFRRHLPDASGVEITNDNSQAALLLFAKDAARDLTCPAIKHMRSGSELVAKNS